VGAAIRGRFRGLELGQSFEIKKNRRLTVVGVTPTTDPPTRARCGPTARPSARPSGARTLVSSVRVRLSSAGAFPALRASLEANRQLGVDVKREDTFYEEQSQGTSQFITGHRDARRGVLRRGGDHRRDDHHARRGGLAQREIGTLRALGFSKSSILASFLFESVVLSLLGGAVGAGAATLMRFAKLQHRELRELVGDRVRVRPDARASSLGSLVFARRDGPRRGDDPRGARRADEHPRGPPGLSPAPPPTAHACGKRARTAPARAAPSSSGITTSVSTRSRAPS
jgi:hypothetical protein